MRGVEEWNKRLATRELAVTESAMRRMLPPSLHLPVFRIIADKSVEQLHGTFESRSEQVTPKEDLAPHGAS